MKIVASMKLVDLNLKNHIYPITLIDNVDQVIIVRDKQGPQIPKVIYYTPPEWTVKIPPMNFVFKFYLLLKISIKEKPDLLIGYLFFPHGLLAFLVGKITFRKTAINLIAGIREIHSIKSKISKYAYTRPMPRLTISGKIILWTIKKFDVIIVGGSFSRDYLKNLGIEDNRIFILRKPVDPIFKPLNVKKEYDIIYLGRLSPEKHIETLIEAVEKVVRKNPRLNVAIVGEGLDRINLEKKVCQMNLLGNIHFKGWQNDPWIWFNRGKISVLTSEREGFAQSVVQSLHCGVPVISTKCGDVSDVIQHGYNGIIINDHEDVNSFAQAIELILQNPQVLTYYSNNAIKTADVFFNVQLAISVWKQIFHRISLS